MKNLLPFLFLIALAACKKKDTTWNTDWIAPAVNDTLRLTSLFNDSTLVAGTSNSINIDLTRTILNIGLSDFVTIPDTTIKQNFNPQVNLSNVPPGYQFVNSIEEHEMSLDPIQLKKIHVSQGGIYVKVSNPIGTKAFFTIQLPGVTRNGVVFEKSYIVDAGTTLDPGVAEEYLDISNYDIDTLAIALYGNQTKSIEDGVYTLYDTAGNIYKQYNLFEVRDNFNELLYEVRQDRGTNIDFSKNFTNIIS